MTENLLIYKFIYKAWICRRLFKKKRI